jgi:hypothetical protein
MSHWKGIVGRSFSPEAFNAYVAALGPAPNWVKFVVLHNTAEPTIAEWHSVEGRRRMQNLETYYRETLHWSAGPHLFCADDLIWVFTPLTEPGVHSPSWNRCSLGVEMVGDFSKERFDFGPGRRVRENAVAALAVLHHWANLESHTLKFHKSDPLTTHRDCPGKNVDRAEMIAQVHHAILALRSDDPA